MNKEQILKELNKSKNRIIFGWFMIFISIILSIFINWQFIFGWIILAAYIRGNFYKIFWLMLLNEKTKI